MTAKKQNKEIQKIQELENNWKRALADYKNLEKRVEEEKREIFLFAKETIIKEMLPVLDNLEMLQKHIKDKGLELTIRNFEATLKDLGVKKIETTDKEFDPKTMEALEIVEGEKNKVIKTVLEGYLINEKLLRPAKVKVGKGGNKNE